MKLRLAFGIACVLGLLGAAAAFAVPAPNGNRDGGLQNAIDRLNDRARAHGLANQAPPSPTEGATAINFDILGHNELGGRDTNGDVWIHGNFAYVGTWSEPCTGRGVKIVDVSDLSAPRVIGAVGSRPGTSAEDVVVRHVSTPYFTGDLLAVGLQRCGAQKALDKAGFGPEFWDVTNPYRPRQLSSLDVTHGGGGVHELDLFQRDGHVYALLATPFSEFFDPVPGGDFRIVDVTNPRFPLQVGEWGAAAKLGWPGPFFGQGSFGGVFGHSARASADGTRAYVSYTDLGVLTLDITDVTDPELVGQTQYPADADGDTHSVAEYGDFLLVNDEDFDPRSPAHILFDSSVGIGNESPSGPPLFGDPVDGVATAVVAAANQGCSVGDYPVTTGGKIVVVPTFVLGDSGSPEEPACLQGEQEAAAEAAGAAAVIHEFIASDSSPQWFDIGEVSIPVLFTDQTTAGGMLAAGSATLEAQEPAWGFLRVFDKSTGQQVAKFDEAPGVHDPAGDFPSSIHNNEPLGDRTYASWYRNGVIALDLSPLGEATPADPEMVGQFLPAGAPSHVDFLPGNVPLVWGVAVRDDGVVFVSDMNGGLWIVRPTGEAAPSN